MATFQLLLKRPNIEMSEQTETKFGTVDYTHIICSQTKFGDNSISRADGEYVTYMIFMTVFTKQPEDKRIK